MSHRYQVSDLSSLDTLIKQALVVIEQVNLTHIQCVIISWLQIFEQVVEFSACILLINKGEIHCLNI